MADPEEPEDYGELVESRAKIQKLLLALHRLLRDHRDQLESDTRRQAVLLLLGAEFALWRAAFLIYANRDWTSSLKHAEQFLEKLVRDNAIGYTQDRATRNWAVGYYLNDAYYRLDDVIAKLSLDSDDTPFVEFLAQKKTGIMEADPTAVWEKAYAVAEHMHGVLGSGSA